MPKNQSKVITIEKRLETREKKLVIGEMNSKVNAKTGINLLIQTEGMSQVQASYRFYNNENVNFTSLNSPIIKHGLEEIEKQCDKYVLNAYDWSHLDYKHHHSKEGRVGKNKKSGQQLGYDHQSSLTISDITGEPIAPLAQNLKIDDSVLSTYNENIDMSRTHLEELVERTRWIRNSFEIKKEIVDIIDREGDSIALMREYDHNKWLYLIRAKNNHKVYVPMLKESLKQGEVADTLPNGEFVKSIEYQPKGKKKEQVKIYVNEIDIELQRDATKAVINEDGKRIIEKTSGEYIKARLVVERLINKNGEIVAQWILLTNVKKSVSAQKIATWYYYRWKIESYFKLLKSAGFNLEKWQQQKPEALFRRLLICSHACVLLWKLQQSNEANAETIKKFLAKISGRLMAWGKDYTAPALLAGLWNFLSMIDILTVYDVDELFKMKDELSEIMGIDLGVV